MNESIGTLTTNRRSWDDAEKRQLIDYWDAVGSIFLISILMDRPEGSIQTEASRLNLPRRIEEAGKQRKKWAEDEINTLEQALKMCTDNNGKIRIFEVAARAGRSIDAIIGKITQTQEERNELRERIVFSKEEIEKRVNDIKKTETIKAAPVHPSKEHNLKPCLKCKKVFRSSGFGNRICNRCKENMRNDGVYDCNIYD